MHVLLRLWQVNIALWGYLAWRACVHVRLIRPRVAPALRFAGMLERLGTTFVKLGQGLSLHGELLPDDYIVALRKLQDHVAVFPAERARAEIEQSLGCSVETVFARFDAQPMAAGSIAQVHWGVLARADSSDSSGLG